MNYKLNILALMAISTGLAQVNFTNPDEGAIVSFQTTAVDSKILKAEGSPYFDDHFKYGQILVNGKIKTTGNLRYNAANSELELQKGQKEYSAVLKRNYISAKIDDKLYKLFPYTDDSNSETTRIGYFIPLNQGESKLLYKPEKKLRRGRTGATNYDRTVPPRFIDISSYYIQIGEEPAEKIYLRKKYFYDILGRERIKNLIKEKDLRLNKEEDAIKVMQYINEVTSAK
ncbi:hypothetical protein GUA46_04845 [Muricauda sp. HICW]|uniref:GLPGLI family protein n=1 Tax=Flagellimonas chongwuensis TaxID=2697365 RepID=A0A850NFH0_9FLAO|nr:hypothetical protein [Allomuricauda chongwuensis]NVN17660.1 hypothetical protein [Allomuricauda chongwuensis]